MADIKKKFADLGADTIGSTQQELAAFLKSEMAKWAEVVKARPTSRSNRATSGTRPVQYEAHAPDVVFANLDLAFRPAA